MAGSRLPILGWVGVALLGHLTGCRAASLPPNVGGGRLRPRDDAELVSKVVEARGAAALPAGSMLHGNVTNLAELMQVPELMFRRSTEWLRKQNPGLWLLLATVMAQHGRGRHDKKGSAQDIRSQVELGEDYHLAVVTTAALPWMTGTAVNPLLRAAYLAKAGKRVTLMVPWLHPVEQAMIFPEGMRFERPEEQKAHMTEWLEERGGIRADFRIVFYPGRYDSERGSILPLGDIMRFFAEDESDICILEEPEHLTWYHSGPNWRHRFKLVVGVVHTNYIFYARTWENGGKLVAGTLKHINQFMCQAYCDKVIKLSDTLQPLPRAVVCNVHGVRADFLEIGRRASLPFGRHRRGAYFLGKALWAKGHRLLIDYLQLQRDRGEAETHIDVFGKGEDLGAIRAEAEHRRLAIDFHGPTDHAGKLLREYKVFVNPSQSEVLSTTTAEALAMGKFAVIQRHPSNDFFVQFRNALLYDSPEEFLQQLRRAMENVPSPLSPEERRALSWEGATERFLAAVTNSTLGNTLPSLADHSARWVHQGIQAAPVGDLTRKISGAGPVARQSWLLKPRYRDAEVTEIVEQSLLQSPPLAST